MPGPIPSINSKPKASNKDIEEDFNTFEYQALVVEPHTTRAGFLFYDVSQLDHPLKGAKLHLHKLRDADGQRAVLLRDSLRQVSAIEIQPDELTDWRPRLLVIGSRGGVRLPDGAVFHAHAAAGHSGELLLVWS